MKFPQGEGSAVIHRKKNRPVLQRLDILDCLFSVLYILGNLLNSSSTQFLVAPFFSKPFFLGRFVRFLSTQLFHLLVSNILLLSMSAFCYVGLLSLFWVWLFHAVFLSSSTQLFSWGVVFWAVCRVRIRSVVSFFSSGLLFGPPVFRGFVLSNLQGRYDVPSTFFRVYSKAFLSLVILLISAI